MKYIRKFNFLKKKIKILLPVYSITVILRKTVLIIPAYIQIFIFSLKLLFMTKQNSKMKCDIVVYQKGRVEASLMQEEINIGIYRFYFSNAPK